MLNNCVKFLKSHSLRSSKHIKQSQNEFRSTLTALRLKFSTKVDNTSEQYKTSLNKFNASLLAAAGITVSEPGAESVVKTVADVPFSADIAQINKQFESGSYGALPPVGTFDKINTNYVPPESWSPPGFFTEKPIWVIDWLLSMDLTPVGAIGAFALLSRFFFLPIFYKQQTATLMMQYYAKDLAHISSILKTNTPGTVGSKEAYDKMNELRKKANPLTAIGTMILTIPYLFICFFSLRTMTYDPAYYHLFKEGGTILGNHVDLTVSCSLPHALALSGTSALLFSINPINYMVRHKSFKYSDLPTGERRQVMLGGVLSVISIPFFCFMPLSIALYSFCNNIFTAAFNLIMRLDATRKLCKLPLQNDVDAKTLEREKLVVSNIPISAPSTLYIPQTRTTKTVSPRGKGKRFSN